MEKIINIIEALFGLSAAFYGFLYYTGRLNYTGDKEKRRKEKVEKYGWILVVGIIFVLIGCVSLLILTLN